MNAHSIIQYNFYKLDLAKYDIQIVENNLLRERIINGEVGLFIKLKNIFLNRMYREEKLICIYCQQQLKIYTQHKKKLPKDMATIEHLVPISQGGLKYHESNWACACPSCNTRRGIKPIFKITETYYIY